MNMPKSIRTRHSLSKTNSKPKVAFREEDAQRKERAHNLRQMLRAHLLMEKDVDYIVAEGKDRHHR